MFFLMDLAENEDLFKYMSKRGGILKFEEIQFISAEIINGLDYIHRSGVVHRDIKPGNILFD